MRDSFAYIVMFLGVWSLDLLVNMINSGRAASIPRIKLDDRIPFLPLFIYFYSLYFPLIVIPLAILFSAPRLLQRYLISSILVMAISYAIFLVFPTKLIRISIQADSFSRKLTLFFHRIVAPYNLLPSMHVSMLVLAFLILLVHRRPYAWILSTPIGLSILSVIFTKQHYILDLIAAVPLAVFAFLASATIQGWTH